VVFRRVAWTFNKVSSFYSCSVCSQPVNGRTGRG
jgi:hypothetical protein